jgi:flavin-dependent dehydrogenase
MTIYDVAIIGAGPAGSVCARNLSRSGLKVILIDPLLAPHAPLAPKIGESLPSMTKNLLRHLDASEILEKQYHSAGFGSASAWGSDEVVFTDSIRDPNGPNWHVNRALFDRDLRDLAIRDQVCAVPQEFVKISSSAHPTWKIQLSESVVRSHVVIDCSGRSALPARQLGARRLFDPVLHSLYLWTSVPDNQFSGSFVESCANGWWYTANIGSDRRVFSFQTDPTNAKRILRTPELWRENLSGTTHIKDFFVDEGGRFQCKAAGGSALNQWQGAGWLTAGDAAMAFDPLSSQGIYNSLYTGMRAAEAATYYLKGDTAGFRKYRLELTRLREVYLQNRQHYYAEEKRWSAKPFWMRQHEYQFDSHL